MSGTKTLSIGLLLAFASILGDDRSARACSFLCTSTLVPAGGTVPANLDAIGFNSYAHWFPVVLTLTEILAEGSELDVPLTIEEDGVARISRALIPGATYRLQYVGGKDGCGYDNPGVTFRAGAVAPLPTHLGDIEVDPQEYGTRSTYLNSSPACYRTGDAVARRVRLMLHPEAQPWADVLQVAWRVEGKWPVLTELNTSLQGGWQSATADVELFRACGTQGNESEAGLPEGLAAGANTVVAVAQLVGLGEQLTTTTTVDIACQYGEEGISEGSGTRSSDGGCGAALGAPLSLLALALARGALQLR